MDAPPDIPTRVAVGRSGRRERSHPPPRHGPGHILGHGHPGRRRGRVGRLGPARSRQPPRRRGHPADNHRRATDDRQPRRPPLAGAAVAHPSHTACTASANRRVACSNGSGRNRPASRASVETHSRAPPHLQAQLRGQRPGAGPRTPPSPGSAPAPSRTAGSLAPGQGTGGTYFWATGPERGRPAPVRLPHGRHSGQPRPRFSQGRAAAGSLPT